MPKTITKKFSRQQGQDDQNKAVIGRGIGRFALFGC